MVELTVLNALQEALAPVEVYMEIPAGPPQRFVLLRKADSGRTDYICQAMFTLRSYAGSLLEAAQLNEQVKKAMDDLVRLEEISAVRLNGDYPFPDTAVKKHCYQAVYDITHY